MALKNLAAEHHKTGAQHGMYLLLSTVVLVAVGLTMVGVGDAIIYRCFGIGLIVGGPMLGFKGLQIRTLSRHHEEKLIPVLAPDKLLLAEEDYIANAAQHHDYQKRKSTYLMIGLMLCAVAGAFTEYAVYLLVTCLSMVLIVAIEYCFSIITEFRLTDYNIRVQRLLDDQ